jgi:bifunctional enzyme CysN/CysC
MLRQAIPTAGESTELGRAGDEKTLLRFITCGSVDDGKSTLIGRMLYESKMIFEDQLGALEADSRKHGTQGDDIDFALLVDGLASEREQGITIDVAYRFFATEKRKFIVADTPGHEQYTRNMATGASTAELAVILVDARKGVVTQTRRHAFIVSLLGIRKIVLAVNKMDLVGHGRETFRAIVAQFKKFAGELTESGHPRFDITAIPVSALRGDNVVSASANMPWYDGPCLLDILDKVPTGESLEGRPFRLPVQYVNRPNPEFRGFCGQIASGTIASGDAVRTLPSGRQCHIKRIVTADGDLKKAVAGQSVTLVLDDEIDVSRGDVMCSADSPAGAADQFETTLLWMAEEAMLPGRPYFLKIGPCTVQATITTPKYTVNVNSFEHVAATKLNLNEIAVCNISTDRRIPFDAYEDSREMGGFILIDRLSNATVAMGMIHFALRRADNIHWQAVDVDKSVRARLKGQKPAVLWLTGLSGSGKSTIANILERKLTALGRHTYLLDGDNVRHGLNRDLGFTDADRVENIRRVAEVARLMADAGLIVLVSFISPFRSERRLARGMMEEGEFLEIHVNTPIEIAEARDVKGLYAKARAGAIKNFTGIDSPYEIPETAEVTINTVEMSVERAADALFEYLVANGFVSR